MSIKVRELQDGDYPLLSDLHDRYYSRDFVLPDFNAPNIVNFAITDTSDRLIIGGVVRPLAETVIVTDKSANLMSVGRALREAIYISQYACNKANVELLHAFVKDDVYKRHLIKWGFHERGSTPMWMRVDNGK